MSRQISPYRLRPITGADEAILWQMLYYAAHLHNETDKTIEDAKQNPKLAAYVTDWGRTGDMGFVAEDANTQEALGAVWLRLFPPEAKAYSHTDEVTPELAIALYPHCVGQGVGTALMQKMIAAAHGHFPAIALNVRAENPALRLYQRFGFVVVQELVNRVGGLSYDMRLMLDQG